MGHGPIVFCFYVQRAKIILKSNLAVQQTQVPFELKFVRKVLEVAIYVTLVFEHTHTRGRQQDVL